MYSSDPVKEESSLQKSRSLLALLKHIIQQICKHSDSRRIALYLLINLSFMFVELVYGLLSNSLGLIADAAHMFFDCTALFIGLIASYISKFGSNLEYSYGYSRYEVLGGLINGILLIFVAFSVLIESIDRMIAPQEVKAGKILLVCILGLLVNIVGLMFFHESVHELTGGDDHHHHHHHHQSHSNKHIEEELELNDHQKNNNNESLRELSGETEEIEILDSQIQLENQNEHHEEEHKHQHEHEEVSDNVYAVYLHILADTLGSVGVIISCLLIKYFGWVIADPICSLIIALLIFVSIIPLLKKSVKTLGLEAPSYDKQKDILAKIMAIEGVLNYEDFHLWTFKGKEDICTIKVVKENSTFSSEHILVHIERILTKFKIKESTIQINTSSIPDN